MTKAEAIRLIRSQEMIFEVARLVDVSLTTQFVPNDDDTDLVEQHYACYAVWNKEHRCENCISAKAFAHKTKLSKFEFVENDVYHVVAQYIEVEDVPYMLELVTKINDETLFGAYGKDEFVDAITHYNNKLYLDPLTKAYNRAYFEEQLSGLKEQSGVAMMDIDLFKGINDTFGHDAGDKALQTLVNCIQACIRSEDSVIRYGGDEFILVFSRIPQDVFKQRLENIRSVVESAIIPEYPGLKLTVSIGGYYSSGMGSIPLGEADKLLYEAKKTRNRVVTN